MPAVVVDLPGRRVRGSGRVLSAAARRGRAVGGAGADGRGGRACHAAPGVCAASISTRSRQSGPGRADRAADAAIPASAASARAFALRDNATVYDALYIALAEVARSAPADPGRGARPGPRRRRAGGGDRAGRIEQRIEPEPAPGLAGTSTFAMGAVPGLGCILARISRQRGRHDCPEVRARDAGCLAPGRVVPVIRRGSRRRILRNCQRRGDHRERPPPEVEPMTR